MDTNNDNGKESELVALGCTRSIAWRSYTESDVFSLIIVFWKY